MPLLKTALIAVLSLPFIYWGSQHIWHGSYLPAFTCFVVLAFFAVWWRDGYWAARELSKGKLNVIGTVITVLVVGQAMFTLTDNSSRMANIYVEETKIHYDGNRPRIRTGRDLEATIKACLKEHNDQIGTIYSALSFAHLPVEVSTAMGELTATGYGIQKVKCE